MHKLSKSSCCFKQSSECLFAQHVPNRHHNQQSSKHLRWQLCYSMMTAYSWLCLETVSIILQCKDKWFLPYFCWVLHKSCDQKPLSSEVIAAVRLFCILRTNLTRNLKMLVKILKTVAECSEAAQDASMNLSPEGSRHFCFRLPRETSTELGKRKHPCKSHHTSSRLHLSIACKQSLSCIRGLQQACPAWTFQEVKQQNVHHGGNA